MAGAGGRPFLEPGTYPERVPVFRTFIPAVPPGPPFPADQAEHLTGRLDAYFAQYDGRLAISLHDLESGATYSYHPAEQFITASIVKLNILVLLLIQAEEEGRGLSTHEQALAERMIRYSSNDAADALYSRIGFDPGFTKGNERLGLARTDTGSGGVWGATKTTTADQIRLLRTVMTGTGPLSRESKDYARGLLADVAPEQEWGVSAAAAEDATVELKNGWAPRPTDSGLWAVNSIGYIAGGGHRYLIAVLSDHHTSYSAGIECVEYAVTEVAEAVDGSGGEAAAAH